MTKQIIIKEYVNRLTTSVVALASDYKFQKMERDRAWDQFVIDRALRPELNAKQFYAIYDTAVPLELHPIKSIRFAPTHYDNLSLLHCQITQDRFGVYKIIWEDGRTGSNPPSMPPEPPRFIAINNCL